MWPPLVRIRYTDGTEVAGTTEQWPTWRADGVDEVRVGNPRETIFMGYSLYWLYRDGDAWVAGCGTVGAADLPPEVIFTRDGEQHSRPIQSVPDIRHRDVKLGWWR